MATGEDWLQGMMDLVDAALFRGQNMYRSAERWLLFLGVLRMQLPYFDTLDIFPLVSVSRTSFAEKSKYLKPRWRLVPQSFKKNFPVSILLWVCLFPCLLLLH